MRQLDLERRVAHLNRTQDKERFVILQTGILKDQKPCPQ